MRTPSKVVPINTVKRKVIKHEALSTPDGEVSQSLHCRSRSNRIDFFLSPLLSSPKLRSGTCSSNKGSSTANAQRSGRTRSGRAGK
jgi:hypothetical protein